jgi:hypothetical protein
MVWAAWILCAGWLVGSGQAMRIGGVMLAAYALMQIKKIGFDESYAHAVSMAIWCAAAGLIASFGLVYRTEYGIPPIYPTVAVLLLLSGTCYLWGAWVGAKSGFALPHSTTSDLLAALAMLFTGWGLGRGAWRYLKDAGGVGLTAGAGN